jgi:hypothetical protein
LAAVSNEKFNIPSAMPKQQELEPADQTKQNPADPNATI